MNLGPIYHWSPREVRDAISKAGLRMGHDSAVCFSVDPAKAWEYSHEAFKSRGVFDLWMTTLEPGDEVHVLPMWGAEIIEVRVRNNIGAKRLRWVGERTA